MTFRSLYSFRRYRGLKSKVVDDFHAKVDLFGKKDPLWANFKNVFRKYSWRHKSTCCVRILLNFTDRKSVKSCFIYLTKKFGSLFPSCFCADRAQNLSGPAPDSIPGVPKFNPNPFTSGGVIAGRVNIVETHHKVLPILGEATASSPSKYNVRICYTGRP